MKGTPQVYIIRSGAFAKIGYSRDPAKRMAQMDRAMPIAPQIVAVFESGGWLEFALHRYLLKHHARHEWFHWCETIEAIVRDGLPQDIEAFRGCSPFRPQTKGVPRAQLGQFYRNARMAEHAA